MEHITASGLQRMFADVADAGTYGCFEYQGISVGFTAMTRSYWTGSASSLAVTSL